MKRIFMILTALFLIFSSFAAASSIAVDPVSDYAELMTESEEEELSARLEQLRSEYGHDTAVVTVPTLNGRSAEAYADDFYDYNGYGLGSDDSGILLLISSSPREYYVTTHGRCFDIFNNAAIDYICDDVEVQLRNDRYFEGCMAFADDCEEIISGYNAGKVFEPPRSIGMLIVMLSVALVIAVIITAAARSTMKNARRAVNADLYAQGRRIDLIGSRDIYLYSNVTRTPLPRNSGRAPGGHISSSGRMHGGGGGRY